MLEDKVSKLQETLNYFKELWQKFIEFLQDKLFSSNKYDDIINQLHEAIDKRKSIRKYINKEISKEVVESPDNKRSNKKFTTLGCS